VNQSCNELTPRNILLLLKDTVIFKSAPCFFLRMTPKDLAMNGREEKQDNMIREEGKMATVFRRVPIDISKENILPGCVALCTCSR
jgi:hypothetical protein